MKKRLTLAMVPLLIGVLLLAYVMSRPRFATYDGADVLTLLGVGALLAVGLGGLFGRIKIPGE